MTSDGPCLVEMNCRSHGWDGAWVPLAKMLTGGYAQPGVALDSHVDGAAFEKIPLLYPSPLKAAGQNVMLVSFFSGSVRTTPGYDKMRKMSSFVALQTGVTVGSKVELTVDLFTAVGVLVLAITDEKQLQAHLAEVRRMEREGLFTFHTDVGPVQGEQTRDMVLPAGHRRTESLEIMGVNKGTSKRVSQILEGGVVVVDQLSDRRSAMMRTLNSRECKTVHETAQNPAVDQFPPLSIPTDTDDRSCR